MEREGKWGERGWAMEGGGGGVEGEGQRMRTSSKQASQLLEVDLKP